MFRIASALFAVLCLVDLVLILRQPSPWILVGIVIGWYVADFGSGLVHMLLDYYPSPPQLELDRLYFHPDRGSQAYRDLKAELMSRTNAFHRLVFDFKRHHPWPDGLGRRSMEMLCVDTLYAAGLPGALGVAVLGLSTATPVGILAFLLTMSILATFAQYFHGMLHRAEPPKVVAFLQRLGVLMTPTMHQVHHDHLDRDFAIVSGAANPLLNPIFRALARAGICREENLEPPRTAATAGVPSPDPRPGLARSVAGRDRSSQLTLR